MEPVTTDPAFANDRVRAAELIEDAQRNPVLSAEQACAIAQVHALLAIERRLAQVCASLDAALVALVNSGLPGERNLVATPPLYS